MPEQAPPAAPRWQVITDKWMTVMLRALQTLVILAVLLLMASAAGSVWLMWNPPAPCTYTVHVQLDKLPAKAGTQ